MISAPSASEILLDYGNYRYFENDEHKDIAEPWTRHQLGDSTITRVKRIATAFGQYFEVQCWQRGGEYERVLIQWKNGKHKASADYWFLGGCWRLSRLVDGVHSTDEVQREVLFFPLMRVFTGSIIRELLAKEGGGSVLVPWIKDPQDTSKMLSVHITTRNAQLLDGEEQIYQYTGDRYEDDARFWLNDAGLLTKYEWAMSEGSHWRVELEKPSLSKLNVDWL